VFSVSRISVLMVAISLGSQLQASSLKGGVARADITPPVGVEMWGFAARKSASVGTIDPLYARVLVLESGAKRVAIVTLDLGRSFGPESLDRLRRDARETSDVSLVLAAASHTHSGPTISDHYFNNTPSEWESRALTKIAQAIHEASTHLVEVRVGAGYGVTYIGYNRLETKRTEGFEFGSRTNRMISSPVDPTVAVLRVDTMDGNPLAILVNYACHPVVFGAENVSYSADFPAIMSKTVETAFGGAPMAFFLQGGAGDIDPYYANTPTQEEPDRWRNWTGQQLGEEAVRVAKTIQTKAESDASLDFVDETIDFRMRWNPDKFYDAYLRTWGPQHANQYFPKVGSTVPTPVSTILINKQIAFAVLPGEPFVELQMDWRNRCPVPYSFFVGYTNGYVGYLPTIRAAVKGGYGGATGGTWVEVGAGERMVNNAIIEVFRMMGQLSDAPE
jgi:neutral ceramidase